MNEPVQEEIDQAPKCPEWQEEFMVNFVDSIGSSIIDGMDFTMFHDKQQKTEGSKWTI